MDERVIDYLYNTHTNKYVYNPLQEKEDKEYYYSLHLTREQIIQNLTEYVEQNTAKFAQSYQSVLDNNQEDLRIIENLIGLFEDVLYCVDEYLTNRRISEYDYSYDEENETLSGYSGVPNFGYYEENECFGIEEYKQALEDVTKLKINNLFKMDMRLLEEAFYDYFDKDNYSISIFEQFKRIMQFIKEKGTLNKLYGDDNWYNVKFDKLITDIYDFHKKKKEIFELQDYDSRDFKHYTIIAESGFEAIKTKCKDLFNKGEASKTTSGSLKFDKYRPFLSSNKNKEIDIDKLIFCKNQLESFQNGVQMPDENLEIFYGNDSEYIEEIQDDFTKIYKRFDSEKFKKMQSNLIISDPVLFYEIDELNKASYKLQGNKLIIGMLCSIQDRVFHLIHIEINDVFNDSPTFEIQYNVIPSEGSIKDRIQLLRFDNWEREGKHKNISNTLNTSTHIHLYNMFDLIRGKENGGFDIAYNLTGESTDFYVALKTFLDLLCVTDDLKKKITKKVKYAHKQAIEKINSLTTTVYDSEKTDETNC